MKFLPSFARLLIVHMVFVSAVPVSFADSLNFFGEYGSIGEQNANVFSGNLTEIIQEAVDDALQNANINNDATTNVTADQDVSSVNVVDIEQGCAYGSGSNALCIEDASPIVVTAGIQHINALSHNLMGIFQSAGSGSSQHANASGSALTTVGASQTVTSDTIVEIFQDCQVHTGVCVQRALPQVLTLASQVIAAAAYNDLAIIQESQSGAVQEANADLAADVVVDAVQNVEAHTFLQLAQICAVDVGMCVQRAMPIVKTMVEQVIDAQADNNTVILQNGAEDQEAAADTASSTDVDAEQNVETHSTFDMFQSCEVKQGLCLQVDSDGSPTYVFRDGVEINTGAYVGELDESGLSDEYSRETVGDTARGICGGDASCSMLDRLLFWLFGPEPEPEPGPSIASSSGNGNTGDTSSARRGHSTNILAATITFLAAHLEADNSTPPPSFGGSADDVPTDTQRRMMCSMRTQLLGEDRPLAVWHWTAEELSASLQLPAGDIFDALRDETICPQQVVQEEKIAVNIFPVSSDGPVSKNAFWNACIRGDFMTIDDIKANPDRDEDGLPRSCASYHTQDSWYHPDLHLHFTWNAKTGELQLPKGYMPKLTTL